MKFNFTSISKRLAILSLTAVASLGAFAEDDGYYGYRYKAMPLPAGAGKIYNDESNDDLELSDITDWTDEVNKTGASSSLLGWSYFYTYAKPNDGWLYSGIASGVKDADGNWSVLRDEDGVIKISETNNPGAQYVAFHGEMRTSEEDALKDIPETPDTVSYILFCRVRPDFASGHDNAGKVYTDNPTNDFGETVTLTAQPTLENGKFLYWTKNDKENGEQITDNPLTINVHETATYYAHFTGDNCIQMKGDEGWMIWYNQYTYLMGSTDGTSRCYRFGASKFNDTKNDDGTRLTYITPEEGDYSMYGTVPHFLHVTEPVLLVTNLKTPSSIITKEFKGSGWTGNTGIDTDTIEAENYYYLADIESLSFKRCKDFVLPANKMYLAIEQKNFLEDEDVPEVIYISEKAALDATGIDEVEFKKAVDNAKVYNIQGMEVKSLGKGIYILNGKKYVNK